MDWRLLLLVWQVLLHVGVGQKAAAAKVPVGCTDAPSSRRQRGAKIGPSAAASELDEVTSSPVKDYWFKTGVEDAERGFMQGRAETKRGDQVVGSYQYSDGNVKVKVVYAADDQGYRVLKEERVTLKPFTKSEVPYQKPEVPYQKPVVPYQKPIAAPKKPNWKPRRPSGSKPRPKPNVYKHPKFKPSFTRYSDPFPGNSPNVFSETSSGTFSGSNANVFSETSSGTFSGSNANVFSETSSSSFPGNSPNFLSGNTPNGFPGSNADVFSANSPDIFSGNSPGQYEGDQDSYPEKKPDLFSGNKPNIFSGNKPDFFSGHKPEPVKAQEPSTKRPETQSDSGEGKFSASYSDGSKGLKLPGLEGLDGYSVKLRTNHGSGYSVQGFVSSPGTPQVVKYGKNGKPSTAEDSGSANVPSNANPFVSEDEFNHSLESRDDYPRARPMRESRPKSKGRKRRPNIGHTDHLAFFVKEPPIDPKVVLFQPHAPLKTKHAKNIPHFRPAEGLRL